MKTSWLWTTLALLPGCNEAIGYDDLVPTSQPLGCVSSEQCTADNNGVAHICPTAGAACQPLFTEDCVQTLGDFGNMNTIRVGALLPFTHPALPETTAALQCGLELAFEEIANTLPGLPTLAGDRPLSLLLCDENRDSVAATAHLHALGVDAVIGGLAYYDLAPASNEVTVPGQMLLLSTNCAQLAVTSLDDNGLTWSIGPSVTTKLDALAGFLPVLESAYRAEHPTLPKIRVAMLNGGDQTERDNNTYLTDGGVLRFNGGKTAAQNLADTDPMWCPSGCFHELVMENQDYAPAVAEIAAFDPHIFIIPGDNLKFFAGPIVAGLESQTTTQPYYLLHDPAPEAISYLQGDGDASPVPALAERFFGVAPYSCSALDLTPSFEAKGAAHCPAVHPGWLRKGTRMYDALYLAALAHLADGNHGFPHSQLTGISLASGLAELAPEGHAVGSALPIDLGPEALPQAIATLLANGQIDVSGESGELDFDIETGSPPRTDVDLACMSMGPTPPDSVNWISSGLEWDENTNTLVGALNCDP